MCDCYWPSCEVKGCDVVVPVHIGDFNYPREDVRVWCGKHIPKDKWGDARTGVEVFVSTDNEEEDYPRGTFFAIELKGGTLRPSDEDVHINIGSVEPLKNFVIRRKK